MPIQLTAEDARQSMQAHVAFKGAEIHAKYGPHIDWNQLLTILADRMFGQPSFVPLTVLDPPA